MKKILFLLVVFLGLTQLSYAQSQQNKGDTSEISKEELTIPDNKAAINDLLEDTKQKIVDYATGLKNRNKYSIALNDDKTRLTNIDTTSILGILSKVEKDNQSRGGNYTDIFTQEQSLVDVLNTFNDIQYGYFDDNSIYLDFFEKVAKITKSLNIQISNLQQDINSNNSIPLLADKSNLAGIRKINLTAIKNALLSALNEEITTNNGYIKATENNLKTLKIYKTNLFNKLNEEETQINALSIKLGLPLFCGTILFLFLGPKILRLIRKTDSTEPLNDSAQDVLLEISTVLLLTMTILILGLSNIIKSDVLGTLIGGISGYVLNRMSSKNNNNI